MTTQERRYAGALDDTIFWLGIEEGGWGVVVSPHTEQREIAETLHAAMPDRPVVELGRDAAADWFVPILGAAEQAGVTRRPGAFVMLAPGLDDKARAAVFTLLNGQRDRTSRFGVWTLIVSAHEYEEARRHAGDLVSVFSSFQVVKFIPRPMSEDEIVAARAELHVYYQRRFGRLDLRGFIRSEQEDVSFPVEQIFQPLQARSQVIDATGLSDAALRAIRSPSSWLLERQLAELESGSALIVGGPGSGKSFFLRWCALAGSRDDRFLGRARPIPVYVPMAVTRVVVELPSLEDYLVTSLLEAGLQIGHVVATEAAAGRVLFLLDGLDETGATRDRLVQQATTLARHYPDARIVVSSRPTGLDGVQFEARRFELEGLNNDSIRALLATWCELYETHRVGKGGAAQGRADGEALGREVVASRTLGELARSPLLATIIAIVHRAGVRLPDHRVELYEHVVRILVERWNDLRSRDAGTTPPILRVPDAVRLLGPVAYTMVEGGRDAIEEEALRGLLRQQLQRGTVRGVADADEALAVFRNSLGLLVEQGPGIYGFLHKTFAEFLAAHEAVRSGAFDRLLETDACFAPRWREVVLLGLGIIGNVQFNDVHLRRAIDAIVASARVHRLSPAAAVPVVLSTILADDPALSSDLAEQLGAELVPHWWFEADLQGVDEDLGAGWRILRGPWRDVLGERLDARYRGGMGRRYRAGEDDLCVTALFGLLLQAGRFSARLACERLVAELLDPEPWRQFMVQLERGSGVKEPERTGMIALATPVAVWVETLFRSGAGRLIRFFNSPDPDRIWRMEMVVPELRGHDVVLVPREGTPGVIHLEIDQPDDLESRRQLVAAVLAAWRELAAAYPDEPQPPASVEEAIAIYGPPAPDSPPTP